MGRGSRQASGDGGSLPPGCGRAHRSQLSGTCCSLRASPSSRANIYESICSSPRVGGRACSGQELEHEHLLAASHEPPTPSAYDSHDQRHPDHSPGRRDPNARRDDEPAQNNQNIDLYSEIQPAGQLGREGPSRRPCAGHDHHHDHYQVPLARSSRVPTINDELEVLIQRKRARTLELLRDKEAPKANNEPVFGSLDRLDQRRADSHEPHWDRDAPAGRSSAASHYDNLAAAGAEARPAEARPAEAREPQRRPDDDGEPLVSSSDSSQNLNTLSLASEIVDLSNREENSLVQQLGPP